MFRLFSSNETILGVDIRPASIQLIQLSSHIQYKNIQHCIEHYAHIHLPEQASEQEKEKHLRALFSALPVAYERVILALPEQVTLRKTLLFHQGIHEFYLEKLVKKEMAQHFSFSNDCYMDFKVLGPSLAQEGMIDVHVIAVRCQIVQQKVALMKRLGVDVDVIDIESCALERVIPWVVPEWLIAHPEKHIAVICLEPTGIIVWVMLALKVIFSQEEQFEESFKKALFQNTESSKLFVLQHVARVLHFFSTNHSHIRIDYIILIGSESCPSETEALFEQYFSIPTQAANPFVKMKKSAWIDESKLTYEAPSLTLACGLALRKNG